MGLIVNLKNKTIRIKTKNVDTDKVVSIRYIRLDQVLKVRRIDAKKLHELQTKGLIVIII